MAKPYYLSISESGYMFTQPNQDPDYARAIIEVFISTIIQDNQNPSNNNYKAFVGNINECHFVNYGLTQLVYYITTDLSKRYALLVNQPITPIGAGKREYDNLRYLSEKYPDMVIKPAVYIGATETEAYVTHYHNNARCVGVPFWDKVWGLWLSEPGNYHFVAIDENERFIINTSMLATLIMLYDFETQQGIGKTQLDGGDFMLEEKYEKPDLENGISPTELEGIKLKSLVEKVQQNLTLIAARELVTMSLDEYIERLRIELTNEISDDSERIVTGYKLRCPFTKDEIEKGISIGLALRNNITQESKLIKAIRKG